jgi:uncharacterized protein
MTEITTRSAPGRRSPLAALALLPIRLWRWMGAVRTPRCRYYPSCSAYAEAVISHYGALRGGLLAVRRVLRCHPWSDGGVDHPDLR